MAFLPVRLQRILYDRLKLYNCVSDDHPEILRDYGGVSICSGGCYKSLFDWFYSEASLFRADFASTDKPLILEVTGSPDCFLANGPYLRTTDVFNGFPVYAQITQLELTKEQGLKQCIAEVALSTYLSSTAPDLGIRDLRAGERLLVRQQNAWVVQSVSAYRGSTKRSGEFRACGFHVLHFPDPDCLEKDATCFSGLSLDMKTPTMDKCGAKMASCKWTGDDFDKNSKFWFSFGSRRSVQPKGVKGTEYKPKPTQNQQFHTDGPFQHDASSMWTSAGKLMWNSDAFKLRILHSLTILELQALCTTRRLDESGTQNDLIKRLTEWYQQQPLISCPVPDSIFQSLSVLFAFFPKTALGVPQAPTRIASNWKSLRLDIPVGTAAVFRFDFQHHGWKCIDQDNPSELPVHFRAHFYLFSGFLPALPTFDFEATLEFLSVLSLDSKNDASGLLMLECLQTFVPYENPFVEKLPLGRLDQIVESRAYRLFKSQRDLSDHCKTR